MKLHNDMPIESYMSFARRHCLPVARADFSPSHVRGGVEVYKWIVRTSPFHTFGLLGISWSVYEA